MVDEGGDDDDGDTISWLPYRLLWMEKMEKERQGFATNLSH